MRSRLCLIRHFFTMATMATSSKEFDIDSCLNPTLSTRNVFNELKNVSADWRKVGVQLHIDSNQLKSIESEQPDLEEMLRAMIEFWLQYDLERSWRKLITALKNSDLITKADAIERRCKSGAIEKEYHEFEKIEEPLLRPRKRVRQFESPDSFNPLDAVLLCQKQIKTAIALSGGHTDYNYPMSSVAYLEDIDFEIPDSGYIIKYFLQTKHKAKQILSVVKDLATQLKGNRKEAITCMKSAIEKRKKIKQLKMIESHHEEQLQKLVQAGGNETEIQVHQDTLKKYRETLKDTALEVEYLEEKFMKCTSDQVEKAELNLMEEVSHELKQTPAELHGIQERLITHSRELEEAESKLRAPIDCLEAKINHDGKLVGYYATEGFNYGTIVVTKLLHGASGAFNGGWQAIWGGDDEDRRKLETLYMKQSNINKLIGDCKQYADECGTLSAECERSCTMIDSVSFFFILSNTTNE